MVVYDSTSLHKEGLVIGPRTSGETRQRTDVLFVSTVLHNPGRNSDIQTTNALSQHCVSTTSYVNSERNKSNKIRESVPNDVKESR
jgi:hypothetical protein